MSAGEGERILDAVITELGDEFIAILNENRKMVMDNIPSYLKFTNPFTGQPFVSEDTIRKSIDVVRKAIRLMPDETKKRIAVKVIRATQRIADEAARDFVYMRSRPLTETLLEDGGLLVRYR